MNTVINSCEAIAGLSSIRTIAYYAHLVPLAIGLFLSIYILVRKRFDLLSSSFFAFVLFFNIWLLGDLITWTANDYNLVSAWWQILDFVNIIAFFAAVYFFDVFALGEVRLRRKVLLLILSVVPFLIAFSGTSILDFHQSVCEATENPVITFYKIFTEFLSIILILTTFFKAWTKFEEKNKRVLVLMTGSLLAFLFIFATTEYWASVFNIYEISLHGLFALPIFQLVIVFVTTQLNTFNLKSYNQQVLVVVLVIMIASQLLFLQNTTDLVLNIFTLTIALFLSFFLTKSIRREMEDKKKIEELAGNLEKTNARLRELDQQKSEFISLASHQLRGPLTAVKGYASLILEGDFGNLSPEVREAVETMYKSTQALVVLVGDYLDVSRIEQGRMKYDFSDFNLKELTESVIHELMPTVEMASLKLSFDFDNTKEYMVHADQGKIKQVISNLIDNATKYTKQGGIHVHIERNHRDNLLISIKDTGIGIPAEVMPRLFEKFIRAPEAGKANIMGTGLGLYVAKKIIEAQRGKIWAESPGKEKGSTFYIELEALHATPKPGIEAIV